MPCGTLQASLPSAIASRFADLQTATLVRWGVLLIILVLAVVSARSFCKVLCPLGALLAPLNYLSFWTIQAPPETCLSCKKCDAACSMDIQPSARIDRGIPANRNLECIVCHECQTACIHGKKAHQSTENELQPAQGVEQVYSSAIAFSVFSVASVVKFQFLHAYCLGCGHKPQKILGAGSPVVIEYSESICVQLIEYKRSSHSSILSGFSMFSVRTSDDEPFGKKKFEPLIWARGFLPSSLCEPPSGFVSGAKHEPVSCFCPCSDGNRRHDGSPFLCNTLKRAPRRLSTWANRM